jgi:hypothetical protein
MGLRVRALFRILFVCAVPALAITACEDPFFGRLDPLIIEGNFAIAAPSPGEPELPSALDVTAAGGAIRGGRFPERLQDANLGWDLTVRVRDGRLVLLPSAAMGFGGRAGITEPVQGQTFEGLADLPPGARFETAEPIAAVPGALHVIRSREFATGFGACVQYAKMQVLEVDTAARIVRVRVATNERCFDTRLVPVGG